MFTTATKAPAREPVAITDRRHLGVAAMSAIAIVVGLAVWFLATTMGYAGENTGAMVGILVASVGLTFFFPALQAYLLARGDRPTRPSS
jgi:hypothetical protein